VGESDEPTPPADPAPRQHWWYVDAQLGKPALVKAVSARRPLTRYIYVRRDYVVMADADSAGEVELYSARPEER
jgi:hypothetical protein